MADSRVHLFANNASSLLANAIAVSDTEITVTTGSLFPNPAVSEIFVITVSDFIAGTNEVMYVTARDGNVLTVERGKENTTAQTFLTPANTLVQMRVTAGVLEYLAASGSSGGTPVEELDELTDVVITSPADGDVLTFDLGTGNWVNQPAPAGGASDLNGLSDVVLTSPANLDALIYNSGSGRWENLPQTAASASVAINSQTGTTYTLVLTDAGKCVERNSSASNTTTVPPNSSVAFPIGTTLLVRRMGTGLSSIVAGSGVTIDTPRGLNIVWQYGSVSLHKRATDEWCLEGSC